MVLVCAVGLGVSTPTAHADNRRLNGTLVTNVYTVQRQAGCITEVRINPQLQLAAQWHANDVLRNRALGGDLGSDGSTPQTRAEAAGYRGKTAQNVAINPSLAINNMEILERWYYDPVAYGIMSDCANAEIGVWSENSLDRSVVVAVFGQPG
ncbi:CAP domain-containing protein [Mycobacterium sp. SMC-8]|uniref:CAP domain-containing protein n=1 Tax=Mycobacterium sp. SMC-8 TaxID=2857060 RepID=UPI0021B17316|nr:CAP domain-containing protein [Mycobacterium sp. SMC-8]UXA11500.1 CAP domain-containing protein [Mycobacterium sp. SMC-8]